MGKQFIRVISSAILALFLSINVYAESGTYKISGILKDNPGAKVSLSDAYGAEYRHIKSSQTDSEGGFSFTLTDDDHVGIYRLDFGKDQRIDLIFNFEDIQLETGYELSGSNVHYIKSRENILFNEYMAKEKNIERKHKVLLQAAVSFPREDTFYETLRDQLEKVEKEKDDHFKAFIKKAPDTYVKKVVTWMQVKNPDVDLPESDRKNFINRHIFDNIDFSDPTIVYSSVIPARIKEFFMINQSHKKVSRQEYEEQIIKLIDEIFVYAQESSEVRGFIVDFLLKLFKNSGLENVYTHVADTYFEEGACETEEDEAEKIRKRSEAFKRLAPGNTAPDIFLPGIGSSQKISDHSFKKALIIFWESKCPFCKEFLKGLKLLEKKLASNGIKVFSISLDERREDLERYLDKENFSWPTYSDFTGMKSKAAQDYFIYATPTIFLLDNKLEIIAKPTNFPEFERDLKKILP